MVCESKTNPDSQSEGSCPGEQEPSIFLRLYILRTARRAQNLDQYIDAGGGRVGAPPGRSHSDAPAAPLRAEPLMPTDCVRRSLNRAGRCQAEIGRGENYTQRDEEDPRTQSVDFRGQLPALGADKRLSAD